MSPLTQTKRERTALPIPTCWYPKASQPNASPNQPKASTNQPNARANASWWGLCWARRFHIVCFVFVCVRYLTGTRFLVEYRLLRCYRFCY